MPSTDSSTEGLDFSLRSAVLAIVLLLIVRLGTGLARGIVEGNYLIGILGLTLAVVPIVWLLLIFKKAYF
jgi:hypothetical protein